MLPTKPFLDQFQQNQAQLALPKACRGRGQSGTGANRQQVTVGDVVVSGELLLVKKSSGPECYVLSYFPTEVDETKRSPHCPRHLEGVGRSGMGGWGSQAAVRDIELPWVLAHQNLPWWNKFY